MTTLVVMKYRRQPSSVSTRPAIFFSRALTSASGESSHAGPNLRLAETANRGRIDGNRRATRRAATFLMSVALGVGLPGGKEIEIEVSPDGKLLKREVEDD